MTGWQGDASAEDEGIADAGTVEATTERVAVVELPAHAVSIPEAANIRSDTGRLRAFGVANPFLIRRSTLKSNPCAHDLGLAGPLTESVPFGPRTLRWLLPRTLRPLDLFRGNP
jgi:hypothetical protein